MSEDVQTANEHAKRGDFRLALRVFDGAPRAWKTLLQARSAMAGLQGFELPAAHAVSDDEVGRETLDVLARAAFISLNARELAACEVRGRRMAGSNAFVELLSEISRARPHSGDLGDWVDDARRCRRSEALIDRTTAAALNAVTAGRLDEAVELARRASRIASAEEMPQGVYFANLALARVRRLSGRPHHACRILLGLERVVPPCIRPWLGWELALNAQPLPRAFGDFEGVALAELIEYANQGDRTLFDQRRQQLRGVGMEWQRQDVVRTCAAIDLRVPPDEALRPWSAGDDDGIPADILGVATHSGSVPPEIASAAYVVVGPDLGRRIVSVGLGLTGTPVRLDPERGRAGRLETLIATLGLAGPAGRRVPDLFQDVYRFAYDPTTHAGVLRTLLHRARARLEGLAEIERDDGHLRLAAHRVFAVHDPRCEHRLEDVVLRMIANNDGAAANDVSRALGVPLRTVQKILKQLSIDGSVRVESAGGRKRVYHVEDTTFAEPTTSFEMRDPRHG